MPRAYAETFARGIAGKTAIKIIAGAGHLAELDKPAEVAKAILDFTA
jgi:pimeloyl-ACP methyl ester carboxylesterase